MKKLRLVLALATMLGGSAASNAPLFAQAPGTSKSAKPAKASATTAPTAAEIADAKSKGMVWVNTSSKIYHKDGKYFGNTKSGKFMTEADAQKAGYRAAQESPIKKKSTTKK
jgi:hypothetical protein